MTNQNGKALRLFELHGQRGDFPFGAQSSVNVKNFLGIRRFVLL